MTKITVLLALLFAGVSPLHAGVKVIGEINGVKIVRVRTVSLLAPSSTVLVGYTPGTPGVQVLSTAGASGVVPAIATGAGIAAGGYLLAPATIKASLTSISGGGTGGVGGVGGAGGGNHTHNNTH